jgi:hypothetical protein
MVDFKVTRRYDESALYAAKWNVFQRTSTFSNELPHKEFNMIAVCSYIETVLGALERVSKKFNPSAIVQFVDGDYELEFPVDNEESRLMLFLRYG